MSSIRFDPSHGPDIIEYYYTKYSECRKDTSYLATSQFLTTFTHSIQIIQTPLVILTGYCILMKTPKAMGSLKWAMLNVHLWNTIADVLFCSLGTPYIFFPTFAGFPTGLLTDLGVPIPVQLFIMFASMGFLFSSVAALFENRSSSFEMNRFRIEKSSTRLTVFILNGVVFSLAWLPLFLNLPDQNSTKLEILVKSLNCPTEEFFTSPVFILTADWFWGVYLRVVLMTEFLIMIGAAVFFIACTAYFMFYSEKVTYSVSTRGLQKRFFVGNLVQIAIPWFCWSIPGGAALISLIFNYYDQSITNISMALLSLHGLCTMIVTLLIHHPYRSFLMGYFVKHRKNSLKPISNPKLSLISKVS